MRKITHTLVAAGLTVGIAATMTQPASAAAFYNKGVSSVSYHGAIDSCYAGQALPCTPNAGEGASNLIQVSQGETPEGDLVFDDVDTTSSWGDDYLWLGATIGAECRRTYDLSYAYINLGWQYGNAHTPPEVQWPGTSVSISVPHARTMPEKLVALNFSLDEILDGGYMTDFGSLDDIYDYGESIIDARIASGMNEAAARAEGFTFDTWVATHAEVGCDRALSTAPWSKMMGWYHPVTIEYIPVAQTPVRDEFPPAEDLTVDPAVTAVALSVVSDPGSRCSLHLSGTITTNAPTDVDYRFVNPYGQPSNTFTVAVDQTHVAMVDAIVQIPTAPESDPGGDLAPPPGDDGGIGGLVGGSSDQWSGVFELETLSPNGVVAVDGFTVDWCS
jgi:hypothetical protein